MMALLKRELETEDIRLSNEIKHRVEADIM